MTKHQLSLVGCLLVVLGVVIVLAVVFGIKDKGGRIGEGADSVPSLRPLPPPDADKKHNADRLLDPLTPPPPSESILGNFSSAAVAADAVVCAEIGRYEMTNLYVVSSQNAF